MRILPFTCNTTQEKPPHPAEPEQRHPAKPDEENTAVLSREQQPCPVRRDRFVLKHNYGSNVAKLFTGRLHTDSTKPGLEQVALLNPNVTTAAQSTQKLSSEERLVWLEHAIQQALLAFEKCDQKRETKGQPKLPRVIVAPEYFFAKPVPSYSKNQLHEQLGSKTVHDRQLSEQEKNTILEQLKAISAQHPDILIMPGTIAFNKSLQREENAAQYARRKGAEPESEAEKALMEKFNNKPSRYIKARRRHRAAIDDGRYLVNKVRDGQRGNYLTANSTHIAKNTAYVFCGGEIIHKQNKVAGWDEVLKQHGNQRATFIPGELNQGNFEFNGVSHSMEICADHANYIASEHAPDAIGDVHIVQSAITSTQLTGQIKNRAKYLVHSSVCETAFLDNKKQLVNGVIDTAKAAPVKPKEHNLVQLFVL